ncbi:phenylacetaldoxime dehydratase family protein [Brevibacillus fluminis]|uniref:Phenylacetaldoxime dehydratase family protein n=1 Tax=Brevibacillus fluminis TaxID=511487 RepID=A0A3M8DWV9_9BACL|nr:phenylacetaldoxime dehydratase family protein [Brevibacillus fluminis]RNB92009.1 phenylacetaldoxime dehydratase family protein [Brevibacillus fluminis]
MAALPLNHEPKSNAWTAEFNTECIVFGQFGIQTKNGMNPTGYIEQFLNAFQAPYGPAHVDRAVHQDIDEYVNHIFLVYWDNMEVFEEWNSSSSIEKYWGESVEPVQDVGLWREIVVISNDHIETIHSGENHDNGVSNFLPIKYTKVHEYWGSMRDRIQASTHDRFDTAYDKKILEQAFGVSLGKRIRVYPPDNICLIRTAQNWVQCSDEERKTYVDLVEPTLKEGSEYIRQNPSETGCLSSKFVYEIALTGDSLDKSCTIAYFLSLAHLEEWAKSHPSHLKIYKTFFEMLKKHNYATELALWHEVSVLKSDQVIFEYMNCHSSTGLLKFANLFAQKP